MKIQFAFYAQKPLPLYRPLTALLAEQHVCLHRAYQTNEGFFIEAEGDQGQLEALAHAVSQTLPVSVFLNHANIAPIEQWSADADNHQIDNAPVTLPYCPHCANHFAKLGGAQFGETQTPCPLCHSEQFDAQDDWQPEAILAQLLQEKQAEVTSRGASVTLSLPKSEMKSDAVMITHAATLKRHFVLSDTQLLGLSAIEKPAIRALATEQNANTENTRIYRLHFPQSRKLLVLAELLRQKGIDWIFVSPSKSQTLSLLEIVRFDNVWLPVRYPHSYQGQLTDFPEPLRDTSTADGRYADVQNDVIQYGALPNAKQRLMPKWQAEAALQALRAEKGLRGKHCTAVMLSRQYGAECVTLSALNDAHTLFQVQDLPNTGEAIFDAMVTAGFQPVIEKFITKWPERMRTLIDTTWSDNVKGLDAIWRVCAILLGLGDTSEALQGAAMRYQGHNGPGIDYPLTNGDIEWVKTFASVMSFLLADDTHPNKIAYGCLDAFADQLASWLDEQHAAINVGTVLLTGDNFANQQLLERVRLRLEKNLPLATQPKFGLSDFAATIGALYLPHRQVSEPCV